MDDLLLLSTGEKYQKLNILSKLLDRSSEGFSSEEIASIFQFIADNKVSTWISKSLVCLCLPRSQVSADVINLALYLLNPEYMVSVNVAVLTWLYAGVRYFFSQDNVRLLQLRYHTVFACLSNFGCVRSACALLAVITLRRHVCQFRVDALMQRISTLCSNNVSFHHLLSVYHRLRPDMAILRQISSSSSSSSVRVGEMAGSWSVIGAELRDNIAKWMNTHGGRTQSSSRQLEDTGTTGQLWMKQQSGRCQSIAHLTSLAEQQRRRVTGARISHHTSSHYNNNNNNIQASHVMSPVPITSVQSVDEAVRRVVAAAATGQPFSPINRVLPLLTDRRRALLLLLSGQTEAVQVKMQFEMSAYVQPLLLLLRSASETTACQARIMLGQLVSGQSGCLRGHLDLAALLGLIQQQASADRVAQWLPAVPLLAFVPWMPHQEFDVLLSRLAELVIKCDRFVRRLVIASLAAMMLNLIERELPLIVDKQFPYNTTERAKQLRRAVDVHVDVVRTASLCQRVSVNMSVCASDTGVTSSCLLLQVLVFCNTVTVSMLKNGVAAVLLVDQAIVARVLLQRDPVVINYMLALFSKYPEWLRVLEGFSEQQSGRRRQLARLCSSTLRQQSNMLTDVRNAVFGVNSNKPLTTLFSAAEHTANEDNSKQLRERLMLLNHTAVSCLLPDYLASLDVSDTASTVQFAEFLATKGLSGFIDFYNVK